MATRASSLSQAGGAVLSRLVQPQTEEPTPQGRTGLPLQSIELTANEIRLLKHLAAGWSSVQIGRYTYRSEKTIRNQLTSRPSLLDAQEFIGAHAEFSVNWHPKSSVISI